MKCNRAQCLRKLTFLCLCAAAATAGAASGPQLPGLATPVVNLDGAFEVSLRVARSLATAAAGPVHLIDLPETSIDAAVAVLVASMRVTARLVLDDALAARLTPAVLGAPGGDINIVGTAADAAVVVGAVGGEGNSDESKDSDEEELVHLSMNFSNKKNYIIYYYLFYIYNSNKLLFVIIKYKIYIKCILQAQNITNTPTSSIFQLYTLHITIILIKDKIQ